MIEDNDIYKLELYIQDRIISINDDLFYLTKKGYDDKIPYRVHLEALSKQLKIIKQKLKDITKNE